MPKRGTAPTCYPVRVFCRVLPLPTQYDIGCVKVNSTTSIILKTPPQLLESQKAQWQRETRHVFKNVFDPTSTQHQVFETSAKPLVEELIHGHNALLLAYGITGSGKTFTMNGNKEKRGILPRCLDLLFRTINDYQTARFVFKPDRTNGFTVQSYKMALKERMKPLTKHSCLQKRDSHMEIGSNASEDEDTFSITELDGDNMYAVFITYIEVYNNVVYDLLEEGTTKKGLQHKIICEDTKHNTMFVPGAIELEVKSAAEAIQVFRQGQQRKRMAETILNVESSRSHTVFNIRLVQAPFDQQGEYKSGKKNIIISQLSLVDLAGSERICRSNNSGMRLREAGNINNSLMTLRTCLKALRDNQKTASHLQRTIPYRQSKITHLFKKFFDGEGQISMIVCINPGAENYEENVQVMEFAEMSQQIEISRGTPKNSRTSIFLSQDSKQLLESCHIDIDDLTDDIDSEMNDMINNHHSLFSNTMAGQCVPDNVENATIPESFKQLCADLNAQLRKVKEENNQLSMDLTALRTACNKEQKRAEFLKENMEMKERDVTQLNERLDRNRRKIKQKNQEIRRLREANAEQKRYYKQRVKEVLENFNKDLDDTPETPCARCRSIRLLRKVELSERSGTASSRCSCCGSSTRSSNSFCVNATQNKRRTKERNSVTKQAARYVSTKLMSSNTRYGGQSNRRPQPTESEKLKAQKSASPRLGKQVSSTSIVEHLEQFKLAHQEITILPSLQPSELGSIGTKDCVKVLLALWQWCNE